ncbi:hypothetical protein [Oceanobacillus sp. FSL H7-0719]|uniref:hypothetical protein n=1 Tax=Oceanobacillus sp. FSL H7-0719 TaxID=2954507 RepID=UPI00324F82DC
MENIEDVTKIIRDSIKDLPKRYKQNEIDMKKLDLETQDLLHVIELGKIDAILRQKLFEDLRQVRQARRKLKEENELLAPVVFTLDSIKNKLPQFDEGLGKIRKLKMRQSNRAYSFRVRHDLDKVLNGRS